MRLAIGLAAASFMALAACGAKPTADAGTRATVRLVRPDAARLLSLETGHHWVPDDVLEYVVTLAARTGPDTFDMDHGTTIKVPVKGPAPQSQAVFDNLPWGSSYRAFVTALGNPGGRLGESLETSTLTTMNATPGTADFVFDAGGQTALTRSVQVVFDAVPFGGQGTVRVATPADGVFINPSPEVTSDAE